MLGYYDSSCVFSKCKFYLVMEDFVTLNLAKKLKEKGFDYPCIGHYVNSQLYVAHYQNAFHSDNDESVDAPTISQVLKWLREEKDIFIEIEYINQEDYGCTIILQETGDLIAEWNWDKFKYANKNPLVRNTYEQTALAGIEYVLDNLM